MLEGCSLQDFGVEGPGARGLEFRISEGLGSFYRGGKFRCYSFRVTWLGANLLSERERECERGREIQGVTMSYIS